MTARSLRLWRDHERKWKRRFLHRIGVLWMAKTGDDSWEKSSLEHLKEARIPFARLPARRLAKRWPQVNFEGVKWAVFEPESGFLTARLACQAVVEAFVAEGGTYMQAAVAAGDLDSGKWPALRLFAASPKNASTIKADRYVFACGPWMGKIFPRTIASRIQSTKQDVFFFGTPPGDPRFDEQHLPVWGDHHERFMYGIPGNEGRGFKIADDTRGPEFDPTNGERSISQDHLKFAREYMGFRFPGMKNAPLQEARVCQYEQTPDSHFIIDRHPESERVWLVAGGSGHGFKHGPALGEMVAKVIIEDGEPEPLWSLRRFGP